MLLRCVQACGGRSGAALPVALVSGRATTQIKSRRLDRHQAFGCGRSKSQEWWKALLQHVRRLGLLQELPGKLANGVAYAALSLTDEGQAFLADPVRRFELRPVPPELAAPVLATHVSTPVLAAAGPVAPCEPERGVSVAAAGPRIIRSSGAQLEESIDELTRRLKHVRLQWMRRSGVLGDALVSNLVLRNFAEVRPASAATARKGVDGLPAALCDELLAELVEETRRFCGERGLLCDVGIEKTECTAKRPLCEEPQRAPPLKTMRSAAPVAASADASCAGGVNPVSGTVTPQNSTLAPMDAVSFAASSSAASIRRADSLSLGAPLAAAPAARPQDGASRGWLTTKKSFSPALSLNGSEARGPSLRSAGSSHSTLRTQRSDSGLSLKPAVMGLEAGSARVGAPCGPTLASPEPASAARSAPVRMRSSATAMPTEQELSAPSVVVQSGARSIVAPESTCRSEGPQTLLAHADDSVFAACALETGAPGAPHDAGRSHRVCGNPNPNDCGAKDFEAGSTRVGSPSRQALLSPEPALAVRSAPMQMGCSATAAPTQQQLSSPLVPAPSVAHSMVAQDAAYRSEGPPALLINGCDRVFAACTLQAGAPGAPRDASSSRSALGKSNFDDDVPLAKAAAIGFETGSARAGSPSGSALLSREPVPAVRPALMQTGYSGTAFYSGAASTQQKHCASSVPAPSDAHVSVASESTCCPSRPSASLVNGSDPMCAAQALESNALQAPDGEGRLCMAREKAEVSRREADVPAPTPAGEEDSWMEALLLT